MPEGCELAVSRDYLNGIAKGKVLRNLSPQPGGRWRNSPPPGWEGFIREVEVRGYPTLEEVCTKGKFMWWRFSFPDGGLTYYLYNSFGMSGGWYPNPSKHTGFSVEWEGGGVHFTDPRHFGTLKFTSDSREHSTKLASLGPCILGGELTREIFKSRMVRKPSRTLSETFLDQRVISGVGNYLRAEIAYASRVSPWREVGRITGDEWDSLHENTLKIAGDSYRSQGATLSTYRTPTGEKGTSQFSFKVYGRKECTLSHPVTRETTPDGRTSHWCKVCQL